jgi:hypothetical protein
MFECETCGVQVPDLNGIIDHQYDAHPTDAEMLLMEDAS